MSYQPPLYPVPPPSPQKVSWRQRFQRLPQTTRAGLGCASLLFILSLCICSVALANTGSGSSTASQAATPTVQPPTDTPAPTATVHHSARAGKKVATPPSHPTPVQQNVPTPAPLPPTPTPAPTHAPVQTGINGNPWGYNFTPGSLIYTPNTGFCGYFSCVTTFWTKTNGYVAECVNGEYTHSGGVSGACSRDGGVEQALYSH
jgi:hypothetical protein